MAKRLASVAKNNPDAAEREEVKAVAEDIDTYASIAAFDSSEGGQLMRKSLVTDVGNSIDKIVNGWRTLSHVELMATCAQLEARLNFLKALTRARTNLELAEEALKEMTT